MSLKNSVAEHNVTHIELEYGQDHTLRIYTYYYYAHVLHMSCHLVNTTIDNFFLVAVPNIRPSILHAVL